MSTSNIFWGHCTLLSFQYTHDYCVLRWHHVTLPVPLQVLYSIDACIRNFKMMNLPLDMEKPTSSYRVGSCFANPEKGTYFDGTGYAKAGEAQYFS